MKLWLSAYKNWLLMSVSLIFGLIAAFSIERHLDSKTKEIEKKSRVPHVLRIVAARDLSRSSALRRDDLATHEFPSAFITEDSISVAEAESLVGKVLNSDIRAGQLIHWVNTSDKPTLALSARLPPGKRAITIPVDQNNSLSGLISPNDLIDLYVSFDYQGKRVTAPLLSAIEVLATGREFNVMEGAGSHGQAHYATLTLATSPQDAVKLVAARQTGTITAVLNQAGHDATPGQHTKSPQGHLAGLLGIETAQKKVIPILYGDRLSTEELQAFMMQVDEKLTADPLSPR